MILIRYFYSNVGAIIITCSSILIMQALISKGGKIDIDDQTYRSVDFIMSDRETELQTKKLKPIRPEEPVQQPPAAAVETTAVDSSLNVEAFELGKVDFKPSFNISPGQGLGSGSGELLPVVQVAPLYPARALKRDIEGYAIVEFSVDIDGTIFNATVIESDPPGVFDRNSLSAIQKFKYRPRLISGGAVQVHGLRKKFKFSIPK